ncbi:MAG: sugar phosphate isomerase/epimerase [Deinococcus sp.]|nr:sugar phosphate isomerase/epimerase [Deinococcus sp.]
MHLAMNGATTLRSDLVTDIVTAGHSGFGYIEICNDWSLKLDNFLKQRSVADLKALLAMNGVKLASVNSLENITFAQDPKALRERCRELATWCAQLQCPYLTVGPAPKPLGASDTELRHEVVAVLRDLVAIAAPLGVGIAYEFLGLPEFPLNTLEAATAAIRQVNHPALGLVIDTFHWYAGNSSLAAVRQLQQQEIFLVHITDAEDLPRYQLKDSHRLFPGRGAIPIRDVLQAVQATGYDGVVSAEILRPEYWDWDPLLATRIAYGTSAVLLKEAGVC